MRRYACRHTQQTANNITKQKSINIYIYEFEFKREKKNYWQRAEWAICERLGFNGCAISKCNENARKYFDNSANSLWEVAKWSWSADASQTMFLINLNDYNFMGQCLWEWKLIQTLRLTSPAVHDVASLSFQMARHTTIMKTIKKFPSFQAKSAEQAQTYEQL